MVRNESRINLYGGWLCVIGGLAIAVVGCYALLIGAIVMLAGLAGLDAAGVI